MTFQGKDIFEYTVPRVGLKMNSSFFWRQAARWARLKWEEFCDLDGWEQSAVVAQYETHMQLEAVLEKHRADEAKKHRPPPGRGRRR